MYQINFSAPCRIYFVGIGGISMSGLAHILLTEGFPAPDNPHYKYFKPQGVYFEACAAGKLLLIEPAAEMFERAETEAAVYAKTGIHDLPHTAQRYRFLALSS